MKRSFLAAVVAVAVGLLDAAPARAQFVVGPAGGFGFGFSFGGHKNKFRAFGGFGGGYSSRSVFVGPAFGPLLPPPAPFGFGFGPSFGFPVPPPVVLNVFPAPLPPFALNGDGIGGDVGGNARPAPNAVAVRPQPDPGPLARPGDFLVIVPKNGVPDPAPMKGAPGGLPLLPPPKPGFRFNPFAPPVVIVADKPDPDPVKEAARLMKLGREAFAVGEYGRAGEQFGRAAAVQPKAAEPLFLKAQAEFAAGGYADAVTAIRAGLLLDPAWPGGAFDPKEPYGANAAAFAAHVADLRKAVAANPAEPALAFLLGYQMWFVGERAEAKKWFELAGKTLPMPGPIALFK